MAALRTAGIASTLLGATLTVYGAGTLAGLNRTAPPPTVGVGAVPPVFAPDRTPPGPRAVGQGSPPVGLVIPALQLRTRVLPVGMGADGSLQVPSSARDLGWWRASASPGAGSGTVVITGHVDTAQEGPGALFRLAGIPMGSRIYVRSRDERVRTYRIAARRSYPKQSLPSTVFTGSGPPRLVLITCGGTFDDHTRSYSHNVVAYATAGPDTHNPGQ
jgi:hypothetical protein